MATKRHMLGGDTHAQKKAAHIPEDAGRQTTNTGNSTNPDPVAGWYALAKPARMSRQQKRTWRRKSRGAIRGDLLALLILAAVAGLLLAGVIR